MDKAWKQFERRVAAKLGGRRLPCDGSRDGADVDAGPFQYQCKLGRAMPSYLSKWLAGIRSTAARSGSTGLVVWKPKHGRDADAVVILSLADWQDWHGD